MCTRPWFGFVPVSVCDFFREERNAARIVFFNPGRGPVIEAFIPAEAAEAGQSRTDTLPKSDKRSAGRVRNRARLC